MVVAPASSFSFSDSDSVDGWKVVAGIEKLIAKHVCFRYLPTMPIIKMVNLNLILTV